MKKQIALIFISHHDLTGGGGAERLLSDTFEHFQKKKDAWYDLYFLTDEYSYSNLRSIGKLNTERRIIRLKSFPNKFLNEIYLQYQFVGLLLKLKLDLIHVWLPSSRYLPFLFLINHFPQKTTSKIAINIVDCSLAHHYLGAEKTDHYGQLWHYKLFFKFLRLDGIFSFYQLAETLIEKKKIPVRGKAITTTVQFCFTDIDRFYPSSKKENVILFSGRLVIPKRPLFFIEAVKIANTMAPEITENWRFLIFGKGPLETCIREQIRANCLERLVRMDYRSDMAPILTKSKVFVSTQDYENFTSQSMLEAMASGNAIIARDVGQTKQFVHEGKNGFLLKEDTPLDLATKLLTLMKNPDMQEKMQRESRKIVTEVHNPENFLNELEVFWQNVIGPPL